MRDFVNSTVVANSNCVSSDVDVEQTQPQQTDKPQLLSHMEYSEYLPDRNSYCSVSCNDENY